MADVGERVAVLEDHDEATQKRLHDGDTHFAQLDGQVRAIFAKYKAMLEEEIPERIREGLDEVMDTATKALAMAVGAKTKSDDAWEKARDATEANLTAKAAKETAARIEAEQKALTGRIPDCANCPQAAKKKGADEAQELERRTQEARDRRIGLWINVGGLVLMFLAYVAGTALFLGKLAAMRGGVP